MIIKYNSFSLNFQKGNIYDIKVVDLEPKLTFLGLNLDDALRLQKDHDEVLRQIQVYTLFNLSFFHLEKKKSL